MERGPGRTASPVTPSNLLRARLREYVETQLHRFDLFAARVGRRRVLHHRLVPARFA